MNPPTSSSSGRQNRRWSLDTGRKREREGNERDAAREEGENGAGELTDQQERARSESTATASGDIAGGVANGVVGEASLPNGSQPSPSRVTRHEVVERLSPPRRGRAGGSRPAAGISEEMAVDTVEMTRGWVRNMPRRLDPDVEAAIDLTGSPPEDEVQIVSSNVTRVIPPARVAPKRRRDDAGRPLVGTTQALVLRMLEQQQAAAAAAAATPPEAPSTNPTCGVCFEAMGKNTDRQMAAGNCGHVYCKPCLSQAVKSRKKCPMCSTKLTLKQIRNIFFEM